MLGPFDVLGHWHSICCIGNVSGTKIVSVIMVHSDALSVSCLCSDCVMTLLFLVAINVFTGSHLVHCTVAFFFDLINWCLVVCWADNVAYDSCDVDDSDSS